ncbi:3-hydroxybutyrate dehydrogenase type 2 [Pseudorhizobium banfieldiae]|uniref:3-hydroxybutyrate dehydrogenase type 2 n=1 Tax=Pseudorhizobium banfieldiae TaxID=1125847 RepID=L0NMY3_9HYPH|nr:SDR family oxidoreductase [Pseudorhizobium banfieldiae]CAD6595597.1 oxidoreductase [arsenite-oxidising bacterium NT-25]CAD6602138.1 oxidoreductase [Rhizobium sp. TCK]CCF21672.1 3-hydroxybutyrate dehydrogenase type 2 [Pseudorhizobium banfieldiae]
MGDRLAGKNALVTGAGQGIGRAIAIRFAEEGASVVATSRSIAKMEDLPEISSRITIAELDVTDASAIREVFGVAGPLDILVNCAGWVHNGSILDCDEDAWQRSLDQNATAAFRTIKATLPSMVERGCGSIINVASVASSITGVANRAAYGASKAAMIGLTKAVARDVIATGVRCNALCPGTTHSPSLQDRIDASDDPAEMHRTFIARQPMGRLGTVEEMAAAAVYLASDETAYMTGQLLVIDGGQTL